VSLVSSVLIVSYAVTEKTGCDIIGSLDCIDNVGGMAAGSDICCMITDLHISLWD
jgi:hypothetical protein